MATQSSTSTATRLEPVLLKLRNRIRGVVATRGALITAVPALGGLLALVALDVAFAPLPAFIRWTCPLVWAVTVAVVAYVWWWLPLRKPLELVRVARWLETRHPELEERISTVLEVSGHGESGMSAQLLRQLATEAAESLGEINPKIEVSTRRARRWLWPAAALLGIWALLFSLWPDPTTRHVVRVLVPTSNLGNAAGRITVAPGSVELIEGDALQITARHSAGTKVPLELMLYLMDGNPTAMPMEAGADGFIHHLGRADRSFEYAVRSGRETSDRFKVTVWPQPRLIDPRVKLEFPVYTGWPAREQALGEAVTAILGTKVELISKINTPIESASLKIDGELAGVTQIERAADGGTLTSRWTLDKAGRSEARAVMKHRLDREFEAARFMLETLADTPPVVKWLGAMRKETRLRPDDLLELGYEVTDDVGLVVVELEVQPQGGEGGRLSTETPQRIGRGEPPVWRGRIRQTVGEIASRWPDSKVFKLRMRVEDSRPADLGGPGIGTSEWIVIRIDEGAQSLARQEIDASHSDVRETIEQARQLIQQAGEKIDRHRHELQQEKMPDAAGRELAKAREQLADAREKLHDLAERMEESAHAANAKDVREAAGTVEQARQQLENAPLQDTPKQRDETAATARENAGKAQRQLEKLRDAIQRREPQLQEYSRLKDLEQQQRELARQAADQPTSDEWRQQQERVRQALRQDVQQQAQAQTATLEQQVRKTQALAAEARQHAAGQKSLEQLAQDPAAVQEQLANEQADIAKQANEQLAEARERQDNTTANALPEAVRSTGQAAKELAKKKADAAAKNAKQAAAQLEKIADAAESNAQAKEASNKSGRSQAATELRELAERQQDLSKALASLAGGKPEDAAAELAEMRADEVKKLAAEIRATPQANGDSGFLKQAAETSEQAAGKAAHAAKAGAQGKPADASANHGKASEQFEQTASHLDEAAAEFAQQAAEAAARKPADHRAPVPAKPLAEAFQAASEAAATQHQAQAASQSQAAADALGQAADGTLRAMRGDRPSQTAPGQPQPGAPGTANNDAPRQPEPDPGVPPELAKLGISAADWEKIKTSLKSETGGSSAIALPEEYRELVRSYFEHMSKVAK